AWRRTPAPPGSRPSRAASSSPTMTRSSVTSRARCSPNRDSSRTRRATAPSRSRCSLPSAVSPRWCSTCTCRAWTAARCWPTFAGRRRWPRSRWSCSPGRATRAPKSRSSTPAPTTTCRSPPTHPGSSPASAPYYAGPPPNDADSHRYRRRRFGSRARPRARAPAPLRRRCAAARHDRPVSRARAQAHRGLARRARGERPRARPSRRAFAGLKLCTVRRRADAASERRGRTSRGDEPGRACRPPRGARARVRHRATAPRLRPAARRPSIMKTIAVVEDNADNRLLLRALLDERFRIVEFETGADAVAGLPDAGAEVVLLDISLPGMDGVEVLARLRNDARTARLPVVALTAHAMAGDRENYLRAGFDEYVTKPIVDETVLFDAIDRQLGKSAA